MSGSSGPSGGQVLQRVKPHPIEEQLGGAEQLTAGVRVDARPPRSGRGRSGCGSTPSTLTPRTAGHPGPGDRLPIGDDRQRLQRRAGQPRLCPVQHEPLDHRARTGRGCRTANRRPIPADRCRTRTRSAGWTGRSAGHGPAPAGRSTDRGQGVLGHRRVDDQQDRLDGARPVRRRRPPASGQRRPRGSSSTHLRQAVPRRSWATPRDVHPVDPIGPVGPHSRP